MDFAEILDLLDKHGQHALMLAVIVQLYMMAKELKEHRRELKKHREDEDDTRRELIKVGTAVTVLLERDRDRFVREEISGVHDADPRIVAMGEDELTPVDAPTPRPTPPPRPSPLPHVGRAKTPPHGSGYQIIKPRPGTNKG